MKKLIRIIVLGLALILPALGLSGCSVNLTSISIDTVMTVDKSFNGSRVMTAEIPATVYRQFFNHDINNVNQLLSKYAPENLYCKAQENSLGGVSVEMRLDFGSLDEYQEEVESICSGNKAEDAVTPTVTFEYSDTALKNGYTLIENFSSLDLLYWLKDAIRTEHPKVTDENLDSLFTSGSTSLSIEGQSVNLNGSDVISASSLKSNAFDGITIEITLNEDDTIDSVVRYKVGASAVKSLDSKLDTLMKDIVPDGGSITSTDADSGARTYRLIFSNATTESFVKAMNQALGSSETKFEVTTEGGNDSLSVNKTVDFYFTGDYFLDYTDQDTDFSVVMRVPSSYSVSSCTGKYGLLSGYDSTYADNMCELTMKMDQPDEVTVVLGYVVDIDSIDVSTYVHNALNVERTITFRMSSESDSLIGDSIKSELDEAASKWPDKMKVEKEKMISTSKYTVSMKADSFDELTKMTRAVLQEDDDSETSSAETVDGEPENSSLSGGIQSPTQPLRKYYSLTDTINFTKFLKGSRAIDGINYSMTFPKYYTAGFAGNTSFENASAVGQTITCTSYNKIISVASTAVKWNLEGILVLALCILSLIVFIVILFFNYGHIVAFFHDKKLDMDGEQLFQGKSMFHLMLLCGSMVCFIVMLIRLIFRVY